MGHGTAPASQSEPHRPGRLGNVTVSLAWDGRGNQQGEEPHREKDLDGASSAIQRHLYGRTQVLVREPFSWFLRANQGYVAWASGFLRSLASPRMLPKDHGGPSATRDSDGSTTIHS